MGFIKQRNFEDRVIVRNININIILKVENFHYITKLKGHCLKWAAEVRRGRLWR